MTSLIQTHQNSVLVDKEGRKSQSTNEFFLCIILQRGQEPCHKHCIWIRQNRDNWAPRRPIRELGEQVLFLQELKISHLRNL